MQKKFDVVGIGLNATDTMLLLPSFPSYAGKVRIDDEVTSTGGQVASAVVTCQQLGLRTKYIGSIGDDERGRIQLESLQGSGVDIEHVQIHKDCPNQSAYIIIDRSTGERTVLWRRDDCLSLEPDDITPDQILNTRLLHIDGHDTKAVEKASRLASEAGIPVTVDVDTIYPGFDRVLPNIDYLIASTNFPRQWTNERDHFKALEQIQNEYGMRVAAMTLGAHGSLALENGKFHYSPAFVVNCVDTTGAGDVFHGAFCYGVLQDWPLSRILDFSNAMGAMNCKALGARAGIGSFADAEQLIETGERRVHKEYATRVGPTNAGH